MKHIHTIGIVLSLLSPRVALAADSPTSQTTDDDSTTMTCNSALSRTQQLAKEDGLGVVRHERSVLVHGEELTVEAICDNSNFTLSARSGEARAILVFDTFEKHVSLEISFGSDALIYHEYDLGGHEVQRISGAVIGSDTAQVTDKEVLYGDPVALNSQLGKLGTPAALDFVVR